MVNIFLGVPAGQHPARVGTWWPQSPAQIPPSGIWEAGRTWGAGAEGDTSRPPPHLHKGGPLRRVSVSLVASGLKVDGLLADWFSLGQNTSETSPSFKIASQAFTALNLPAGNTNFL